MSSIVYGSLVYPTVTWIPRTTKDMVSFDVKQSTPIDNAIDKYLKRFIWCGRFILVIRAQLEGKMTTSFNALPEDDGSPTSGTFSSTSRLNKGVTERILIKFVKSNHKTTEFEILTKTAAIPVVAPQIPRLDVHRFAPYVWLANPFKRSIFICAQ